MGDIKFDQNKMKIKKLILTTVNIIINSKKEALN